VLCLYFSSDLLVALQDISDISRSQENLIDVHIGQFSKKIC